MWKASHTVARWKAQICFIYGYKGRLAVEAIYVYHHCSLQHMELSTADGLTDSLHECTGIL